MLCHSILTVTTKQTKYSRTCQAFLRKYFWSHHARRVLECALNKVPHDSNHRTVEELYEDADINSRVCELTLCYLFSVVLQPNCGLGRLVFKVPRTHTGTETCVYILDNKQLRVCIPQWRLTWFQTYNIVQFFGPTHKESRCKNLFTIFQITKY